MNMYQENMLTRAKGAVLARDFETAARLFRTVLKKEPRNTGILLQLGSVYVRSGQDQRALQVYKTVNELDPQNFEALNSLGGIYRRIGDYEESIAVLECALTTGENTNAVYYNMGHTYKLMGNYSQAEECFNTVIEENPNDVLAYNHLGSIQALRGKHQKALQTYTRALQLDPNHPVLHYNAALSYTALGKYADAKLAYENALRSKPGWIEAMDGYAALLSKLGLTEDAKRILIDALQLDPDNVKFKNALAAAYLKQGHLSDAEKWYKKVLAEQARNQAALAGLSAVYMQQKKYRESVQLLEQYGNKDAGQPDSGNTAVRLLYIDALLYTGQVEKARQLLDEIMNSTPDNPDIWNLYARLHIKTDRQTAVAGCFEHLAVAFPTYIAHFRDCALFCNALGKYTEARAYLQEYLNRRKDDGAAYHLMGKILEALHDYTNAYAMYKRALEFDCGNEVLKQDIQRLGAYIDMPEEDLSAGTGEALDFDDIFQAQKEPDEKVFEEPLEFAFGDTLPADEETDEVSSSPDIGDLVVKDAPLDFSPEDTPPVDFDDATPKNDDFVEDQEYMDVSGSGYDFEDEDLPDDEDPVQNLKAPAEAPVSDDAGKSAVPPQPENRTAPAPQPENLPPPVWPQSMPPQMPPAWPPQDVPRCPLQHPAPQKSAIPEPPAPADAAAPGDTLPPDNTVPPEESAAPDDMLPPDDALTPEETASPDDMLPPDNTVPPEEAAAPDDMLPPDNTVPPEETVAPDGIRQPCRSMPAAASGHQKLSELYHGLPELLKELRKLAADLPEEKKKEFFEGNYPYEIDRLIECMNNLSGLLAAAEEIRSRSTPGSCAPEKPGKPDAAAVVGTLEYLRTLAGYLPNRTAARMLSEKIAHLLGFREQIALIFG